jgi:hypothetical protein
MTFVFLISLYTLLFLVGRCKIANSKAISFLDHHFPLKRWNEIQRTLNCFSTKGSWEFDSERFKTLDHREDYSHDVKKFQTLTPCPATWPAISGHKDVCNTVYEGKGPFYNWVVPKDTCGPGLQLERFSFSDLCHVFRKGNILFIGDSMTGYMKVTMVNSILSSLYGKDAVKENGRCIPGGAMTGDFQGFSCALLNDSSLVRPNSFNIGRVRNDDLSLIPEDAHLPPLRRAAWIPVISPNFTTSFDPNLRLVIINRGIHIQENTSRLIEEIRQSLTFIRRENPSLSIIWRNTVHGHYESIHPEKVFFDPPLKSYDVEKAFLEFKSHPELQKSFPASARFHYEIIPEQNRLVSELLTKEFPEVLQLDVLTSSKLRRDGKMDPLHYCIPGPMDAWIDLLLAALKLVHYHGKKISMMTTTTK